MYDLLELMANHPIVPFIRESDFAVRKPWRVPKRRLLDYLLVYIQEGHCRFWVDDREYHFRAGDFCLIQPNRLIELEGLSDTITPFAHFDIFYHANRELSFPTRPGQIDLTPYLDLLQPRLNDVYGIHIPVRFKPANAIRFRETLLEMVELWQHRNPMSLLKAQHLATDLIISLLEGYYGNKQTLPGTVQSLHWISSYFSLHLSEHITLRDMAAKANLSPSRFSTLFKKQFGVSPHQYLLDLRIHHARELLETTDIPQEEIASYCGFADIHHFSKAFKKRTGIPPGSWRKNKQI